MRIDAALPRTSTYYIISYGEIVFNLHVFHLHVFHLHDYLQERNYGVNQEVPVYYMLNSYMYCFVYFSVKKMMVAVIWFPF